VHRLGHRAGAVVEEDRLGDELTALLARSAPVDDLGRTCVPPGAATGVVTGGSPPWIMKPESTR